APSPPAAAAALAALELLGERPHRVARLQANARALRRALAGEGFPVPDADIPIVPLVVGQERAAMALCQAAVEGGVFAQAIRPPTVAHGTSRLRLATMATHTATELRLAAKALAGAAREVGLDPARLGEPALLDHWPATLDSDPTSTSRSRSAEMPASGLESTPGSGQESTPGSGQESTPGSGQESTPRLAHIA
ncbi:MAG TPA: aminotransferase class I/II-fold pyridoxal phosphate-dependent enzyme, partial [Solirubrobacteraceae bacterium]|nr:aminotransferase class I/II-fold pyridoxal phosphate-dependent enzyme [Solirubrobacteraceae bacterium]